MTNINAFALQQAESAAARLWALGSAQFPVKDGAAIQRHIEHDVTDTAIAFAIHVRRLLDNNKLKMKFQLSEPFRHWEPAAGLKKVSEFREALNRIVHATSFTVGFERLPADSHKFDGGAIGVIWLETVTDQRESALFDVFSLASCFFHHVLPALEPARPADDPRPVH